jgi:hypothetical protein
MRDSSLARTQKARTSSSVSPPTRRVVAFLGRHRFSVISPFRRAASRRAALRGADGRLAPMQSDLWSGNGWHCHGVPLLSRQQQQQRRPYALHDPTRAPEIPSSQNSSCLLGGEADTAPAADAVKADGIATTLRDAMKLCLDAASARAPATPIEIREPAALRDDAAKVQ